jgi:hypothetical protein
VSYAEAFLRPSLPGSENSRDLELDLPEKKVEMRVLRGEFSDDNAKALERVRWRRGAAVVLAAALVLLPSSCSTHPIPETNVTATPDVTATEVASATQGAEATSLTWKSACLLSVAEVDKVMVTYGFRAGTPVPFNNDTTDAACEYDDTSLGASSTAEVIISVRPYGDGETYGWLTDGYASTPQSWAAPDASEAAANACRAAQAWTSRNGLAGICGNVKGVPYAVDPARVEALSFPTGKYFYIIENMGIGGNEQSTQPLVAITGLVANRVPS